VPQGVQTGNRVAPTQPYSVGMPAIATEPLTEKSMWGATFFDQLACRIRFRQLNYEGEFTPVTTRPTLIYPGYYGGVNWGSVAIDERTGYLVINDIRMPRVVRLVPRQELAGRDTSSGHGVGSIYPQDGPYAAEHSALNSPLDLPYLAPPWGTFTAINLNTRQVVWQRPAGTIRDIGSRAQGGPTHPSGHADPRGPIATGSGLISYAGTIMK
jgi:quinate dehydrogenase (quinone)